jgi:MFS transporter, putative metabolite:H+ symporter
MLPSSRYTADFLVLIALGRFFDCCMLFSIGPISAHFFGILARCISLPPPVLLLDTFVGGVTLSPVAHKGGLLENRHDDLWCFGSSTR